MICERPFIRCGPHGAKKVIALSDADSRLQCTPFPCGSCKPCRIMKSSIWKNRLILESTICEKAMFLTLTYHDKFLPEDNSLKPEHLSLFIKRLRKEIYPIKFRYFAVGEYGERKYRPHYHLAIFGIGKESTESIDRIWGKGFTHIGELNNASANYIVGYVIKGLTNEKSMTWYKLNGLHPEFMRSSKNGPGGIGLEAIIKIAKSLREGGHYDGQPIYGLNIGGRRVSLGNYLTTKLAECLHVDKEAFDANFWAYQASIILKHQKGDSIYVENIIDANEGPRINRVRRQEIFKAKRTL